jgi:transcriptional regulator with XRE-family HTH domain
MTTASLEIGKVLLEARQKKGYSRNALVHTKKLKGKITGEGLRKIEYGERIPKFPTLRLLADTLGISDGRLRQLEKIALEKQVERLAKKTGREKVTFQIEGKPIRMLHIRADKHLEDKVRNVVEDMAKIVDMYGVMDEDVAHFRRHARTVLLKQFSA